MVRTSLLILTLGVHLGWHVANRKSRQYAISRECVCVSHSVSKSFYTQGAGARWGVSGQRRHPPPACKRTCDQLLSKLFYSLSFFAFMVVCMIRPPNQVSMHSVNSVC